MLPSPSSIEMMSKAKELLNALTVRGSNRKSGRSNFPATISRNGRALPITVGRTSGVIHQSELERSPAWRSGGMRHGDPRLLCLSHSRAVRVDRPTCLEICGEVSSTQLLRLLSVTRDFEMKGFVAARIAVGVLWALDLIVFVERTRLAGNFAPCRIPRRIAFVCVLVFGSTIFPEFLQTDIPDSDASPSTGPRNFSPPT
jgi:hypothetical protein